VKFYLWVIASVTTVAVCITAVSKAYPEIEPIFPVSRFTFRTQMINEAKARNAEIQGEARQRVAEAQSIRNLQRDVQIDLANGKLEQTKNEIAKWQLEGLKTQDPTTKQLVNEHVHALDSIKRSLEDQINTLRDLRSKGQ
jgi:hypothetical protein